MEAQKDTPDLGPNFVSDTVPDIVSVEINLLTINNCDGINGKGPIRWFVFCCINYKLYFILINKKWLQSLLLEEQRENFREGSILVRYNYISGVLISVMYMHKGTKFYMAFRGYDKLSPHGLTIHGCVDG